jgi:hypothetical protein
MSKIVINPSVQLTDHVNPDFLTGGCRDGMVQRLTNQLLETVQRKKDFTVIYLALQMNPHVLHIREFVNRLSKVIDDEHPHQEQWWLDYKSAKPQFICEFTFNYGTKMPKPEEAYMITAGFTVDGPLAANLPQEFIDGADPIIEVINNQLSEVLAEQDQALYNRSLNWFTGRINDQGPQTNQP